MNKEIITLLTKHFGDNDFYQKIPAKTFKCKNKENCKFDELKECCLSPQFGKKNSKIMIVAEAPSVKGKTKVGPQLGGMFENVSKTELVNLLKFVKKKFKTVPYFTDYIKCGIKAQNHSEKDKLLRRQKACFSEFLIKEIESIKPTTILVCKPQAFNFLIQKPQLNKVINAIGKNFKMIQIHHYSWPKQSGKSYKELNRIWKWQINDKPKKNIRTYAKIKIIKGKPFIVCCDKKKKKILFENNINFYVD